MAKKRSSGNGGAPVAKKAAKKGGGANGISADAMRLPHIRLYDKWVCPSSMTASLQPPQHLMMCTLLNEHWVIPWHPITKE